MLNVGLGADSNETAIAAAERHEERLRHGRLPPDLRRASSTTSSRPRSGASPEHEKVRAIGETGIDHYRESASPGRAAARLRGADRDRRPSSTCRSSSTPATRRARRAPSTRSSRSSTSPRPRRAGDPPLLPRPLARGRRDRARLVLLLLGDRHLPEVRRPAGGGGEAAGRAAPGRDRRPLPGAAAGAGQAERAGPRGRSPRGKSPRSAAKPTSSSSGPSRPTRARSSTGETGAGTGASDRPARAELPRRPQPARRDRPRRRPRAGRRRARGRAPAKGF